MIDWSKGTKKEIVLCSGIAKKAHELVNAADVSQLIMSLQACHTHGCELRLTELLEADGQDLVHDVYGIHSHINKETGELEDCFLPRYAV